MPKKIVMDREVGNAIGIDVEAEVQRSRLLSVHDESAHADPIASHAIGGGCDQEKHLPSAQDEVGGEQRLTLERIGAGRQAVGVLVELGRSSEAPLGRIQSNG